MEFHSLYQNKNNSRIVQDNLSNYLLSEIYSPEIIRQAWKNWKKLPDYVRDNVDHEMKHLIQRSDDFSNDSLQEQIQALTITRAIQVLLGYKNCRFPLTKDKNVKTYPFNFLSKKGEFALKTLLNAAAHQHFSQEMYELALSSTHKFLLDLSFYKDWNLDPKEADLFVLQFYAASPKVDQLYKKYWPFKTARSGQLFFQTYKKFCQLTKTKPYLYQVMPVLQMTQGCENNCSHCVMCAQKPISHMPYVMFLSLHKSLMKYYKYYEKQPGVLGPFERFYADSDCVAYHDNIIGADAGDVVLKLTSEKNPCFFITKGITGKLARRSLAKAAMGTHIHLSFVDTPKENMPKNITQAQQSIKLVQSIPSSKGMNVEYLHMQGDSGLNNDIFFGAPRHMIPIHSGGRANNLPQDKIQQINESVDVYPYIIRPNGQIMFTQIRKGFYRWKKLNDLFRHLKKSYGKTR